MLWKQLLPSLMQLVRKSPRSVLTGPAWAASVCQPGLRKEGLGRMYSPHPDGAQPGGRWPAGQLEGEGGRG